MGVDDDPPTGLNDRDHGMNWQRVPISSLVAILAEAQLVASAFRRFRGLSESGLYVIYAQTQRVHVRLLRAFLLDGELHTHLSFSRFSSGCSAKGAFRP